MRVESNGTIVLSRRNLLALLHKLDKPGSARTLIGPLGCCTVRAEDDAEHYAHAGRVHGPGEMTPDTEQFIAVHTPRDKRLSEQHDSDTPDDRYMS